MHPGGMFTTIFFSSPASTASSASPMTPMCQPGTNSSGKTTGAAISTKS